MRNSGCLDYSEFPNILATDLKGEYFARGTENASFFLNFLDKEVEDLDDHGCPKINRIVDLKADENFFLLELPIETQAHTSMA